MTAIRKLFSVWVLSLVGSILFPLASPAVVTSTMHDLLATTTTTPAISTERTTTVETVGGDEISLQSIVGRQEQSLLGLSRLLVAPKSGMFRLGEAGSNGGLPRTMDTVLDYANRGGVGLDGISVRIIDDASLEGRGLFGWTKSADEFHLYPDAFSSEETLIKTLGHERTHVYQNSVFGGVMDSTTGGAMERAAYGAENSFWEYFQHNN